MRPAKALHLSRCVREPTQDGSIQLIGKPEKLNESFSDIPGYGGLSVAWVQLVYHGDAPCCSGFGDVVVEVMPSDLGSEVALGVYRRRDGRGFPHSNFYNFVVADSLSLPPAFDEWFVEVEDSDPICLSIVRGEWMLRKPVAGVVHVHAALQAPCARSGVHTKLSEEQQRVLDSPELLAERGVIRILAAAGSGKTTTLLAIAEADACSTVHVVFNKSMQSEAESKFAHTFVDCRTWDSLARSYVQRHFNNGRPFDIIDNREDTLQDDERLLWQVVQKFCQSADDAVSVDHVQQVGSGVPLHGDYGCELSDAEVADHAQAMYDRFADCSRLPDHGVVLKMCQLDMRRTGRRLSHPAARRLLCDEFQDVNPVQADVARMEATSCLVVAVGGPGQSIYKFRGACHALQDLRHEALTTFKLSGSFRFGSRIAGVANFAQSLHADDGLDDYEVLACRGVAEEAGTVRERTFPSPSIRSYTVICKTNKQAITHALDLSHREPQREVILIGEPLDKEFALYRSLSELERGGAPFVHRTHEIGSMDAARRVGCMLKGRFRDFDLDCGVKMWSQHGRELLKLPRPGYRTAHRGQPTAVFCTVHQAKGLEWDTVVLGSGCGVTWKDEIGVWQLTHSAVNCLYVAVTRARKELYIPEEVAHLLRTATPWPPQTSSVDVFQLFTLGIHQLFHVIPASRVGQVKTEGLESDSDSRFVCLSGCKSRDDTDLKPERQSLYVVEVDLDILNTPGVCFRMGGEVHTLDQICNVDKSAVSGLDILVPRVPKEYVRRTYPLHPNGSWQSRHGGMSATQWFTSFGSDRDERAGRILAGSEAARRGARGEAWMIMPMGPDQYMVPSKSQAGRSYAVDLRRSICECPDFQQRGGPCKHILAAKSQRRTPQA